MNNGEPFEPDPGLVGALSALDEALWNGNSTPDPKAKVLESSGDLALPLIAILNALHAASNTGEAVADSTWNAADQASIADSMPAGAPRDGSRFGRFQIQACIGQGGSGLVFRARDPQLARDVALKIPRAETLLSSEARKRFQREAELVAALRHPSVVPVYEAGEVDGIPFIVEEFCSGENLASWMARRREGQTRAPWLLAARWMLQIADALARVHACGIVHRDLKPPNILLEPLDDPPGSSSDRDAIERLLPRITDFGIARFLNDDRTLTGNQILRRASFAGFEQRESIGDAASTRFALLVVVRVAISPPRGTLQFAKSEGQKWRLVLRGLVCFWRR